MKGFRKAGRAYLSVSLLLIIAIALLVNVNVAKAENGDSINPDQLLNPIRSITLAQGQSASVGLSQIGPYGFNSVAVTSIGNTVASATLGAISAPGNLPFPTGLHFTFIIGTGSFSPADISVGFVPWAGTAATIDIGPISFYWATTNVFIISDEPITPDNPATYSLTVR
jgi:hypothetical protein